MEPISGLKQARACHSYRREALRNHKGESDGNNGKEQRQISAERGNNATFSNKLIGSVLQRPWRAVALWCFHVRKSPESYCYTLKGYNLDLLELLRVPRQQGFQLSRVFVKGTGSAPSMATLNL